MICGLATWHYPHRSMAQNIAYFAKQGFPALSIHGKRLAEALDRGEGENLAEVIGNSGILLTVHGAMPRRLDPETIKVYKQDLALIGAWHKMYGHIHILSFDVPAPVREQVAPYIQMALDMVENCLIAVEDFGLTELELSQIQHLKKQPRFGFLVDIGHMFIRMRGQRDQTKTLFAHSDIESPIKQAPTWEDFKYAFLTKEFPIFEMHLHNNDGTRDIHLFLEDGEMDISAVAKALRAIDYQGVLTIESAPGYQFDCYGAEADERIMQTYAYFQKLYG